MPDHYFAEFRRERGIFPAGAARMLAAATPM